jgi:HPt (histidine-containing phosphotransfer) domain-containing protein
VLSPQSPSPLATESTDAAAIVGIDAAAPPRDERPSALDPQALARLAELDPKGRNHLLARVLTAFQTSVARLRPQAVAARLSGDRATLRLVAHTLKSSSASIGAMQLSQLCARIETAIRLDTDDGLQADLDALGGALDDVLQAIEPLVKERA